MEKQNVIYSYNGIFLAILKKKDKVLIHVTTWMNFDNNTLSERS